MFRYIWIVAVMALSSLFIFNQGINAADSDTDSQYESSSEEDGTDVCAGEIEKVKLVPIEFDELQTYYDEACKTEQKLEDNFDVAEKNQLLAKMAPQNTELHGFKIKEHFFVVTSPVEKNGKVGFLMFSEEGMSDVRRRAFLQMIYIFPKYQSRGFGKGAMIAFEKQARSLSVKEIFLHVDGSNRKARSLYEKCGFQPVAFCGTNSIHMSKVLD